MVFVPCFLLLRIQKVTKIAIKKSEIGTTDAITGTFLDLDFSSKHEVQRFGFPPSYNNKSYYVKILCVNLATNFCAI